MMRILLSLLTLASAAPVLAASSTVSHEQVERRYTKDYETCTSTGDAAAGVQSAMNACAADEYKRQDIRLNQAYVMVLNRVNVAGKTKLRMAQRGWIKLRDRKCAAKEKEYDGGSIAPLIFFACMTDETIRRTMWLENYRAR
jgi:uncharacterized protein YecT (DUF1311 family)